MSIYLGGGKYYAPGIFDDDAKENKNVHTEARLKQLLEKLRPDGNTEAVTKGPAVGYPLRLEEKK